MLGWGQRTIRPFENPQIQGRLAGGPSEGQEGLSGLSGRHSGSAGARLAHANPCDSPADQRPHALGVALHLALAFAPRLARSTDVMRSRHEVKSHLVCTMSCLYNVLPLQPPPKHPAQHSVDEERCPRK